jgi:hypothetical protein
MAEEEILVEHAPKVRLVVERCWTCGSFWGCERRGARVCPVCATRKLGEAEHEVKALTHRLNAQKAATARAGKGRKG